MTEVRRLYVLLCGYELLDKTISVKGASNRFVLAEPISAYLLQTSSGYVLIDAGANSELVNDPKLRHIYYTGRGWNPPTILPQHELSYQLAAIGVAPGQITRIVLSHMHLDHTGNLKLFPGAEVYVQRREYEYAFSADHSPAWFEIDYALPNLRWHPLDGDYELLPGVELVTTYGHTPGHQSVVVTLPNSGTFVLTADAGDLRENFEDEVPPGENIGDEVALQSIRRLKQIVAERNGTLFLGHDPQFIQTVRLTPEFYD